MSAEGSSCNTNDSLDINDHGKVYIACKPVSSKWRDLGARLGVLENALATVEANHRLEGVERCMSAMLSVWLRRPQGEVTDGVMLTWRNLCVALSPIDRVLAEGIAVEHDCSCINPTVVEVYSKNNIPPAFLPQSCGCGQCTIRGWMTGKACQNLEYDWRPKLLVVDSSSFNPSVKGIVEFGNNYHRQAKLCTDSYRIVKHFATVSITTWLHLTKVVRQTDISDIVVVLGAWLQRPLPMVSNIHELQNLLHSLRVLWFSFGALHFLAEQFLFPLYPEVMTKWNNYCTDFKEYCSNRNLKDYTNVFFQVEDQNIFLIEVDECHYSFTLTDVENFRESLSIALGVPAVSLHLVTVRQKCLIIYLYYCFSDYLTRFKSLSSQQLNMIAVIKPHKILSLTDLYNRFKYDNIQSYYEVSTAIDQDQSIIIDDIKELLKLWKKRAHIKEVDLSKKEAENEFLKDQLRKNEDQLELERKNHLITKAKVMELQNIISKKEEESSLTIQLQLWKKQAHVKDVDLSKKQAENETLKHQLKKNEEQLLKSKAEVMELKDFISKKEEIIKELVMPMEQETVTDKKQKDIETSISEQETVTDKEMSDKVEDEQLIMTEQDRLDVAYFKAKEYVPAEVIVDVNRPCGIIVFDNSDVIVAEYGSDCVTIIPNEERDQSPLTRTIKRRSIEQFTLPSGIAITKDGHLLVTELNLLHELTIDGVRLKSVGGKNAGSGQLEFNRPFSIAVHSTMGQIFVAEFGNNRIQVLNDDLTFSHMITLDGDQQLHRPCDVALDNDGYLYIAERGNDCITKVTTTGEYITRIGSRGRTPGQLVNPSAIAINNNILYITEIGNSRVSIFNTNGHFLHSFDGTTSGKEFNSPRGIAIDKLGNLYVNDTDNNRIVVYRV